MYGLLKELYSPLRLREIQSKEVVDFDGVVGVVDVGIAEDADEAVTAVLVAPLLDVPDEGIGVDESPHLVKLRAHSTASSWFCGEQASSAWRAVRLEARADAIARWNIRKAF